ncbi:hypothetical protein GCM10009564_08420 [Streptomyces thermogriseus]|uniref:Uncharacterized protein n=1 Tax=Streptomyces thermogriseus TaxID=75292 RepID=A0ABN1SUF2_9ACTN
MTKDIEAPPPLPPCRTPPLEASALPGASAHPGDTGIRTAGTVITQLDTSAVISRPGGRQGAEAVGGGGAERGAEAGPQGRARGEDDETDPDGTHGHGDAAAREQPGDERRGHGSTGPVLRGRPGCRARGARSAAGGSGKDASVVNMAGSCLSCGSGGNRFTIRIG